MNKYNAIELWAAKIHEALEAAKALWRTGGAKKGEACGKELCQICGVKGRGLRQEVGVTESTQTASPSSLFPFIRVKVGSVSVDKGECGSNEGSLWRKGK